MDSVSKGDVNMSNDCPQQERLIYILIEAAHCVIWMTMNQLLFLVSKYWNVNLYCELNLSALELMSRSQVAQKYSLAQFIKT